jgi:putative transposase
MCYNLTRHKQLKFKEVQAMPHYNTVFSQMLRLIPRHQFSSLEKEHGTGRKPRSFTRWNQFVSLLFMQLTARAGLRDSVESLKASHNYLYHLGLKPVPRSTFSDANNTRPSSFFRGLFDRTYAQCRPLAPKHKFKFKNKLYSMDGTVVSLCLSVFPWAKFRKTKAGVRLHTLVDHDGYLPAFMEITDAKKHEVRIARSVRLPKGSIVAIDKGYTDYQWFGNLDANGIYFVTRQKRNAQYRVIDRKAINKKQGLTSDQMILLTGTKAKPCSIPLRRIGYRDPETGTHYTFLTNNFKLSAKTICDIYKERWQIEIFFRWIKQNLKIKTFIGNSENAVLSQIYVAMITYLMLSYLKFLAKIGQTPQAIIRILQLNLFRRCPIEDLFNPPPPDLQQSGKIKQLSLALT